MSYSMTEIETHCRKAARGAGLTWGEAEEAGQAVRRLSAAGLKGAEALLAYLTAYCAGEVPPGQDPIKLGAQLIDGGDPDISTCHTPLLLLPFVTFLAIDRATSLGLKGRDFHGIANADGSMQLVSSAGADSALVIAPCQPPSAALIWRAECSDEAYQALNAFCMKTYAPETDERREAGAGAGDDGND